MDFATPLKTIEQGKQWIEALHAADLMFHFEDSPETIINIGTGERIFSDADARHIRARVDELYSFDWGPDLECPIGYALTLMDLTVKVTGMDAPDEEPTICELKTCFPDDEEAYAEARKEIMASDFTVVGGGAAPTFRIERL